MKSKSLTQNQAMFFVFEEVLLVVLAIAQLYILLGLDIPGSGLKIFANPAPPIQNVLWFCATLIMFATAYFFIALRDKKVMKIHENFSKILFGVFKQKVKGADKNVFILLITEFVFAIVIAYSIFVYLDPEVNLVPWPWNFVAFFGLLGFGLYIFSQTKVFRETYYGKGFLVRKIRPAERLFPTRRLTTKTGNIRVASKHRYSKLRHHQKPRKTFAEKISSEKSEKANKHGKPKKGKKASRKRKPHKNKK